MQNRRKHYRVDLSGGVEPLGISVRVSDLVSFDCSLLDASAAGLGVVVRRAESIDLREQQIVTLELHQAGSDQVVSIPAVVQAAFDLGLYARYGFQFVGDDLEERLPTQLWRVFNRRTEARLQLGRRSPIEARLEDDDRAMRVSARLRDVSATGVSVQIRSRVWTSLDQNDLVRVSFALPTGQKLSMGAIVRNVDSGTIHKTVGVEFDPYRTEEFQSQQIEIYDFICGFLVGPSMSD